MEFFYIVCAVILNGFTGISGQIDLASENNAIQGKQFTFICTMTTLSRTVTFFDPQSRIAGSCIFPEYVCDSGYGYKLSQNVNPLRSFLTIDNLNRTLHQGIWKCVYGKEQARMNLSVITFPDKVNLEGLQNDVDVSGNPPGIINVTCSCSCLYPDAMFGLSLVVGKSEYPLQSYTYEKQSIDPSFTCADQLENAYKSQLRLNILSDLPQLTSMSARLRCYVTVSAVKVPVFGMSVGRIIFSNSSTTPSQGIKTTPSKDTSTTPPQSHQLQNENGTNVGAIVGGVIGGLIFVVLVVVVVCVLIRRRNEKCLRNSYKAALGNPYSAEGYYDRRFEKHSNFQTRENQHELAIVGTHSRNLNQSASWNIGQNQPDSNSLVFSFGPRNNLSQLAQNMPEGTTCAFIRERVTEDAGRKITDHDVFEFRR